MSMSDPLGDMITRIRNGQQARKSVIGVLYSRLHERVCEVLVEEGYIRAYKTVEQDNNKKIIEVELKYAEGQAVIREIGRVSRPGCRVYTGAKDMKRFYNGLGILVVSTPQGVMADHKARDANIGGEVLCQVF